MDIFHCNLQLRGGQIVSGGAHLNDGPCQCLDRLNGGLSPRCLVCGRVRTPPSFLFFNYIFSLIAEIGLSFSVDLDFLKYHNSRFVRSSQKKERVSHFGS